MLSRRKAGAFDRRKPANDRRQDRDRCDRLRAHCVLTHDLILKNGRVIDPASGLDRVVDIAFAGGKVAAGGEDLRETCEMRAGTGPHVSPSGVDRHTTARQWATSRGSDPDVSCP